MLGSCVQGSQRPGALALPDWDVPVMKLAAQNGKQAAGTPQVAFAGQHLRQVISRLGRQHHGTGGFIGLYALLETAFGLGKIRGIARCQYLGCRRVNLEVWRRPAW